MRRSALPILALLSSSLLSPGCNDPALDERLSALVTASLEAPPTGVVLPGLEAPVRVVYDEFGIPHVLARSQADAARVQGFLHARDRLFQMDLTRRQVGGRTAELRLGG